VTGKKDSGRKFCKIGLQTFVKKKKKGGMQTVGGAYLHKETDEKFNKSEVHLKKEKRKRKRNSDLFCQ
jgi:hypothetical protein